MDFHSSRWLCVAPTLAALLVICGCSDKPTGAWSGYAEGDYVYIAAPLAGRLEHLAVRAGQQVAQGDALFDLEAEAEAAASDEAVARLRGARAQADNLNQGRRAEEIAVTEAQLAQTQARAGQLQADLQRQQQLVGQGFVARARVEDAAAALREAQARVVELQSALRVARLPARTDERTAAQAASSAAVEVLRQARWREAQKHQRAPSAALVAELFYRQGELVQAGQPVLSLLPPANVFARFFVPEADLARLPVGAAVSLSCDGCSAVNARVRRVAPQAEYTPPVIYSNAQRARLVFMVEARPDPADAVRLHPGQPLDVRPAPLTP